MPAVLFGARNQPLCENRPLVNQLGVSTSLLSWREQMRRYTRIS